MLFTFDVSDEDIKTGEKNSPSKCPIANGIRRACPKAFKIHVSPSHDAQSGTWWSALISSFKGHISFPLDQELSEKARKFDRTGEMEPFSHSIEI